MTIGVRFRKKLVPPLKVWERSARIAWHFSTLQRVACRPRWVYVIGRSGRKKSILAHALMTPLNAKARSQRRYPAIALFLSVAVSALGACTKPQASAPPTPPVSVAVGTVTRDAVPVLISAIGTVEAYSTVSIKAQVSGELVAVHFIEGDSVRKGQLLLEIDPRPYEAVLAQAQAAMARDKAVAANNRVQAQRESKLLEAGIVPIQDAEALTSTADAADALVKADEAAIQTAQINLEFCKIYSPIDGRTGELALKVGNLVKVADVPILVINQLDPIFVNFTVPQQYLPDIKKFMGQGPLHVSAVAPSDSAAALQGALSFVDNSVDATTGTIHLRATFANALSRLWPGLYVNVLLTLSKQANATVVPAQAIVPGQNGPLVYVVKSDNTVEARAVVSDRTVQGEAVIDKGLQPGETIVTDGQSLLVSGAKISIKNK
jgi:multidrug efflux system membrane fusion protein